MPDGYFLPYTSIWKRHQPSKNFICFWFVVIRSIWLNECNINVNSELVSIHYHLYIPDIITNSQNSSRYSNDNWLFNTLTRPCCYMNDQCEFLLIIPITYSHAPSTLMKIAWKQVLEEKKEDLNDPKHHFAAKLVTRTVKRPTHYN